MTTEEDLRDALAPWQRAEGGPTLDAIKAQASRRSMPRSVPFAGVALAATALLAVAGGSWMAADGQRNKGAGGLPEGAVQLDVFVDGASLEEVADGGSFGADDRAVFRVRTSAAGLLTVLEEIDGVWVVVDQWSVGIGVHTIGGEVAQSWRPDRGAGEARYRAVLCEGGGTDGGDVPAGCVFDERRVIWSF